MSKPLHAVGPGELAPRLTVTEASERTERELLVATLRVVAAALDDAGTAKRDVASLSKRVIDIHREVAAIDAREEQEAGERGATSDEAWSAV